jgi:hypothetical protein
MNSRPSAPIGCSASGGGMLSLLGQQNKAVLATLTTLLVAYSNQSITGVRRSRTNLPL